MQGVTKVSKSNLGGGYQDKAAALESEIRRFDGQGQNLRCQVRVACTVCTVCTKHLLS